MLDRLGQVVKNSPYDCYTRVNQTTTYSDYMEKSAEIAATTGIDYVGLDPYENTMLAIDGKLRRLRKSMVTSPILRKMEASIPTMTFSLSKLLVWDVAMKYSKSLQLPILIWQTGLSEVYTIPISLLRHTLNG